jgi:hypothetical protein
MQLKSSALTNLILRLKLAINPATRLFLVALFVFGLTNNYFGNCASRLIRSMELILTWKTTHRPNDSRQPGQLPLTRAFASESLVRGVARLVCFSVVRV